MVMLGQVVEQVAKPKPKPKGQILVKDFVERKFEEFGYTRAIAGDADFDHAVDALCVAAGSRRGILVTGQNGCGKTKYLKAVWYLMITDRQWVNCTSEDDVELLGSRLLFDESVFLDDLGAERFKYGDYDQVGSFICRWYDRHNPNRLLFVSTNLSGSEIDARYGGRIFDRLRELCVILPMQGGSKRREIVITGKVENRSDLLSTLERNENGN